MRRFAASLLLAALVSAAALAPAGCGSSPAGPTPGSSPTLSPSPSEPLVLAGAYVLEIVPAAVCGLPSVPLTVQMTAAAAPTPQHQGVQVVWAVASHHLEAELQLTGTSLRGGFGSIGVLSEAEIRIWLNTIAEGTLTRSPNGRGEVLNGVMTGYLALGGPVDLPGALGACDASHSFSLRAR